MNARREKEQSRLGAAQAAALRAQVEQAARKNRAASVTLNGRAPLRVMVAGSPPDSTACVVLQSGRLADCPVFLSGRLAD